MKVVFLPGPYRAPTVSGIVANIERAKQVAIKLWQAGFAVICPHLNTALFDGLAPDSVWLEGDLEILSRCDMVIALPGYGQSEGSMKEIMKAIEKGIQVHEWADAKDILDRLLPLTRCHLRFRSEQCGYVGDETGCAKTIARCRELGNEKNFVGIPEGWVELSS